VRASTYLCGFARTGSKEGGKLVADTESVAG